MALLLAVGSPTLITYSLALTILNSRSINRRFRYVKDRLHPHLKVDVIRAVRSFLIQSQQMPMRIITYDLAQLIVCPENWAWWQSVRDDLQATKRGWTFSLYAQVGWVAVAQILAIVDFFTTKSLATNVDTGLDVGVGLAINSLWIWMIPVVSPWAKTGTQQSAASIEAAISRKRAPALAGPEFLTCGYISIHDQMSFDDDITEDVRSSSQASLLDEEEGRPSLIPGSFLGFSIAGCALEAGPIFSYARVWSHITHVENIFQGFKTLNKQLIARRSVSNRSWTDDPVKWIDNLQGSPEEMSKYINIHSDQENHTLVNTRAFTEVYHSCAIVAFIALALQWGSTGAAIAIAYKQVTSSTVVGNALINSSLARLWWDLGVNRAAISCTVLTQLRSGFYLLCQPYYLIAIFYSEKK